MTGKYRISGALFSKDAPNGPVFSGVIEIDGVKHAISLWEKTSAAGNQYLQVSEDKRGQAKIDAGTGTGGSFTPAVNKFKRPAPQVRPDARKPDDLDSDDIPFAPEFR
jgi:hypothetical protein